MMITANNTHARSTAARPAKRRRVKNQIDAMLNRLKHEHVTKAGSHADEPFYPRVAAVEMANEFRSIARQLCPRDPSTQDDLVQEMALAVMLCREPQSRSTYRLCATWRAMDYIRWWRKQLDESPDTKNEQIELTSDELDKCCDALNRLLRGEA